MAAKNVKKKKTRRLKRQVRKTLGALFLASAVAVAAIPTDSIEGGNTQAAVTTNGDGTSVYTHVVNPGYYDGSDASSHSEKYPIATTDTAKSVFLNTTSDAVVSPNIGVESRIPICETDSTIYSTGDGDFQFAYVNDEGDEDGTGTKFAVVLGYNHLGSLANGTLTIPNTLDAYLNYNENDGTATGFVAVGKSGNYLFYESKTQTQYFTETQTTETVNKTDGNGNQLYIIVITDPTHTYYGDGKTPYGIEVTQTWISANLKTGQYTQSLATEERPVTTRTYYSPCNYSKISEWEDAVNLYYYDTSDWKPTGTAETGFSDVPPKVAAPDDQKYGRIKDAEVVYIGNQYLKSIGGGWAIDTSVNDKGIITTADKGIFQSNGNIGTLIVGSNLSGIGDYAFYGCTALKSITLENGLNTIGNHAFDNCRNMTTINLPDECNITTIGAYAFKDCQALTSFVVPINVTSIGDGAFKGCTSLTSVNLVSAGNGSLSHLGSYVFQNCTRLANLTFPSGFSETVELSSFEGCSSLAWIRAENTQFNIVNSTTCDFDWEAFKLGVTEQFYIEAPDTGRVHQTCTDNEVSFKYLDRDIYELTKKEKGEGDPTVTYQVDSTNTLLQAKFNGEVESLTFPSYIGPYYIANIGTEAFRDHCSLKEITISSTIRTIGARAFQGCHNLKYVYFDNDTVEIGEYAFQTQEVLSHENSCTTKDTMTSADNTPAVPLHFVGTVGSSSTAYNYAMSYEGRYSTAAQTLSFIEYVSGWPTCLTVRYHYNTSTKTGYSELVDFPTLSDLSDYANAEYLSDSEKAAAKEAIANMTGTSGANLTEDQETFINASRSLTIPAGVDAIEDGLFYMKTNDDGDASQFPVYCYGLTSIEAGYYADMADADGFPKVNPGASDFAGCPNLSAIYLYGDTGFIAEGAFDGCEGLKEVHVNGATSVIGNHAFSGCKELTDVSLSGSVQSIGIRPFAGCENLSAVDFQDSTYFVCDNSVIYGLTSGVKTKLIECLEGRTSRINASNDDLAAVTSMEAEAFQNAKVTYIDLSASAITNIPERAFADTTKLTFVDLPSAATASSVIIQNDAFKGSYVSEISGAQNVFTIAPRGTDGIRTDASDSTKVTSNTDTTYNHMVTIYAPEGSNLYNYAKTYDFTVETVVPVYYYTVTFRDWNEELGQNVPVDTQTVERGGAAVAPEPAGKEGYVFDCWDTDFSEIYADTFVTAVYKTPPDGYGQHLVTYIDYDDTVYATEWVDDGGDAAMSFKEPTRKGYTFTGWRGTLTNITSDITVYAEYNEGYLVRYFYYDDEGAKQLFYSTYVAEGEDGPVLGAPVTKTGYTFTGWLPSPLEVVEPTDTYAQYVADGSTGIYTVSYYTYDGQLYDSYQVVEGGNAPEISGPAREGYTFSGWVPAASLKNVTADKEVQASYTKSSSDSGDDSNNGSNGNNSNNGNNSSGDNSGSNTAEETKYYTLTVRNGSGSGSYVAGSQPIIVADDPASNQEFSSWSIDPADTFIASKVLSATVITMPAQNVTITANYKAKGSDSSTGAASGNNTVTGGSVGSTNSGRPSSATTGTANKGGTTVVIDKNGLSNTGVVSATVNGSSDNFVIKITESSTASEAVLKALMAEYGSDLTNIKYFPMDISLYDSTGTTKITDTTGLSISITLPLPDSLITYAGNNKVAGVVNDKLDKLTPKFTTINGVACVTFTAEHFSPYVIYVDTGNLSSGTVTDNTPKTGDGIHPKWFLSIGLACISVVLFMQKDGGKRKKVKVRTA